MGIVEAMFYVWKRKCGNLGVLDLRKLLPLCGAGFLGTLKTAIPGARRAFDFQKSARRYWAEVQYQFNTRLISLPHHQYQKTRGALV